MLGALGGVVVVGMLLSRSPTWAVRLTLLYGLVAVAWSFGVPDVPIPSLGGGWP